MLGLTAFLVALTLALFLTPVVLAGLHRSGVLDHPNERSSHDTPVVRGGGISMSLASLGALVAVLGDVRSSNIGVGIVVAAIGSGLIGLAEDLRGVATLPRFVLQFLAGGAACVWLLDGLGGPVLWRIIFAGGALLWIPAYVNGFNFMDGINGISAVQSAIAGGLWWWLGTANDIDALVWGGAILTGAALGFLPFNFPKARLFIGDVGSYFIGGWQAAMLVVGFRAGLPPEAVIAPLALYLVDTATTIIRRVRAGAVWHQPHREHAYQRLIRQGWSHVATTATVGAFVVACSLVGLLTREGLGPRIAADIAMCALLAVYLALPRYVARRASSPA
jgi:UDP-N-acetylmuramyl pentapeptide phosphotransferase/UDP-N-acetylglucosamine-1-phosphate transferase